MGVLGDAVAPGARLRPPRVIEVFADVWCPFTHVGLRRLVERRAALGRRDVVLRVRAWPLELVNGEPLTGPFVAEEVDALRSTAAPDLFKGFDSADFPRTTIPALSLAAAAYRHGDEIGERVSLALRTALFEEGRDVGDPEELTAIADAMGFDPPETDAAVVNADWREGKRRGVLGSPHFFVGDQSFFCPTLDIEHVDGRMHVDVDTDAFTTFVAAVFDED